MSYIVNLDSRDNMTYTEVFTEPLRGVLGGKDYTNGQDKDIYEVGTRILMGVVLFTVGLPYTFFAILVLVVPPIWTAIAQNCYCCCCDEGNSPVDNKNPIGPNNPPHNDQGGRRPPNTPPHVKPKTHTLVQEQIDLRKEPPRLVKKENESCRFNLEQSVQQQGRSSTIKREVESLGSLDDDSSLTDSTSSEPLPEERSNRSKSINLKKSIRGLPEYRKTREMDGKDYKVASMLANTTKVHTLTAQNLKTLSLVCDKFENFQIFQCTEAISEEDIKTLRKAIIDNLQHPTIIQIGTMLSLVFPVLKGRNSDEMNESAAIFVNFWERGNPDVQLWVSIQQGALHVTEAELPLDGNVDQKKVEAFQTLLSGFVVGIEDAEYKLRH